MTSRRVPPCRSALLSAAVIGAAAALFPPAGVQAQDLRAAVVGDTIRVGDVVPVALRTTLSAGQRVAWPDTLPLGGPGAEMENAARVRVSEDTLANGGIQVTAVYSVVPWRPGEVSLPELTVPVISADEGVRGLTARLPPFQVASVLPADTTGIEPRPAKGVIGRSWVWWPFLLGLLALAALIAGVWWYLRRRRGAGAAAAAPVPALPPREAALAALDRAREARLAEHGEMKEFYTRISAAIRDYLAALEEGWGEDRTTTELLAAVRAAEGTAAATALASILRAADQVKFARRDPGAGEALEEWAAAREWVERFRPPPAPVEEAA